MSEFKVGDRVRIVEKGITGTIYEVAELVLGACLDITVGEYEITNIYKVRDGLKIYINLKERDLELIEKAKEPPTLEDLEQRIEKLEKCVMGEQNSLEKSENVSSMSKNGLLTEDERVILRNLDKKWKWIARDLNCGNLYLYVEEPLKDDGFWKNKLEQKWCLIHMFNHLFQFIKWEDDEPYNIEELLKGECGNE